MIRLRLGNLNGEMAHVAGGVPFGPLVQRMVTDHLMFQKEEALLRPCTAGRQAAWNQAC